MQDLPFNVVHKDIGVVGGKRRPHGSTMRLKVEGVPEFKIIFLEDKGNKVQHVFQW